MDLIIPDPSLSLEQGAVDPWTKPQHEWAGRLQDLKQRQGAAQRPVCDLKAGRARALVFKAIREFFAEVERRSTRCTCACS
jgi:excinuclease ABC subunit A